MKTVTTKDELIEAVNSDAFPFTVKIAGEDTVVVRRGQTDHRHSVDIFYAEGNKAYAYNPESDANEVHELVGESWSEDDEREDEQYIDSTPSLSGNESLHIIFGGRFVRPLFQ